MVFSCAAVTGGKVFDNCFSVTASADKAEDLLASAHDMKNATVFDGTDDNTFKMSGRTYTKGFTIKSGGTVSFNTEGLSSLDFTIGHVDNSQRQDSKIKVQFDGKDYAEFEVNYLMDLMDYHLDTKGAKKVTISLTTSIYDNEEYGFGSVKADGAGDKCCTVPEYGSNSDMLQSVFDKSEYTLVFDGTTGAGFNMFGRTYYQGAVLPERTGFALNVEQLSSLSFVVGHNDGTRHESGNLNIWVDGTLYEQIPLSFNMKEIEYTLDVSKAKKVYIFSDVGAYSGSSYCVANIKGDSMTLTKPEMKPAYNTAAEFLNSSFDRSEYVKVFDGTTTFGGNINGRTYNQGLLFDHGTGVSFNVDNVKKLSFDYGHVDNTALYDGKLFIYADGEQLGEYPLGFNMPIEHMDIDVSKYAKVRFYVESSAYTGCQYMIGDVYVDGMEPEKKFDVPEYSEPADFLHSAYNKSDNVKTYDGKNKIGFKLNGKDVYQGVEIPSRGRVAFNTENVGKVTFSLGHVDNTGTKDAKVNIYLDNKLKYTFDAKYGAAPEEYTVNVNKYKNMYIYIDGPSYVSDRFALANITLDPPFDEPDALLGDVNDDGVIDIEDAVSVIGHVNGQKALTDDEASRADVDGNGVVDIEDAVAIISHVNGLKSLF